MPADNTLIEISAFSGFAGAVITQTVAGVLAYINDKRKFNTDVKLLLRNKKVEIAENYYFVTGETMSVIRKNINFWKNRNNFRGESSLKFLDKNVKSLNAQIEKLNADNWKQNLISLYFNVALSYDELILANSKSQMLYLRILDLADKINNASESEKEALYGQYHLCIFDLCSQYEDIYALLQKDMNMIKQELLNSYH